MPADDVRNRTTLLQAARVVFQRDGLSAQMDVVAAAAGHPGYAAVKFFAVMALPHH